MGKNLDYAGRASMGISGLPALVEYRRKKPAASHLVDFRGGAIKLYFYGSSGIIKRIGKSKVDLTC